MRQARDASLHAPAQAARISLALLLASALALGGCGGAGQVGSASTTEAAAETASAGQQNAESATSASAFVPRADARVSYLGPEGTYTQEACERFFGGEGTYLSEATVADAVDTLVQGASDYAVIPQENTIGGPVTDYVDVLLGTESVSVVGEVELPITQNLLVLPNADLADIKQVYSHKQGIAQGKDWLEENLPDAKVTEVSSTAEGARMVADLGDRSCAAIASAGCADVYGLKLLAAGIQQNDSNKTRFYVLSKDEAAKGPSDRMAFVATGTASALPALLSVVADQGLEVIAVHDRPEKTELGRYRFLIECASGDQADFDEISKVDGFAYRFLGCFPVL